VSRCQGVEGEEAAAAVGPVVLFDGVCNLCAGSVRFIVEHERAGIVPTRFAALQSEAGRRELARAGVRDPASLGDSIVVIEDGRVFTRSDAAVRIARRLRAPWRWMRVMRVMPGRVRDWMYEFVARRRYRWFGKRESCLVPTPELRGRFLQD
jgi:predicted DCC family thiol-disulfide oxidoreductase YuxK